MTSKSEEALEKMCSKCRYCPFELGKGHCEEYNVIKQDLKVLEILKNTLDNNTLYRVFPHDMAKRFEKFIKSEKKVKEWLENE